MSKHPFLKSLALTAALASSLATGFAAQEQSEAKKTPETQPGPLEKRLEFLPPIVIEAGDKKLSKAEFIAMIWPRQSELLQLSDQDLKAALKKLADGALDRIALMNIIARDAQKPAADLVKEDFDSKMKALSKEEAEAFEKRIEAEGKTVDSYRDELASEANAQEAVSISSWIASSLVPKVKLEDAEIEKFYKDNQPLFQLPETVAVRHILITPRLKTGADQAEADAAALAKAQEILSKLKDGADFGKLAEEYSDCPSGKASKGRLGEFAKDGQMVKDFEDAAFAAAKPGLLPSPVKTVFGYHIVELTGRNAARSLDLDAAKPYIVYTLKLYHVEALLKEAVQKEKEALKGKINF